MLGTVVGLAGPAIQIVQWVAVPIKRQFNYLFCFNTNIKKLRDEADNLDVVKRSLQIQVDRAKNNVQVILPNVEHWLNDYAFTKYEMAQITNKIPDVETGWLKLGARYRLSRKAKKMTHHMKKLCEKSNFSRISEPQPPASTEAIPMGTTYDFESRKHIEEDIMTSLRSKDFNTIGICGMGGIGKTTMAKKIMNRVLEEHVFDEVVMVVISQQVDNVKIQVEIGGSLGFKQEEESSQARTQKLRARLTGTTKILLVLDDVWKSLELEDLGIPCKNGSKGCTILLTSRNMDVLRAMNVGKICGLQILSEEESWFLFREKTGTCVDDTILNAIAKDVMRECKGLPIALATIGIAMKDENGISIWEDALRQLKKSNPSDIPNIITEVYNHPLKLSYDYLNIEHAKSMFVLCCLFAEDDDIPLEHLTYFAMGLRLFEDILEVEETRGRMRALIKLLKARFLLLDGSDEDHVRMHDVVRDVSIFIASQKKFVKASDCTWLSSFVDGKTTVRHIAESGFPYLKLLLIDNKVEQETQINDSFIGGTTELNVMFIKNGLLKSLPSIPHTTQLLKKLRTLLLYHCEFLVSISVVGEFESLESLICHRCGLLKEIPEQLRGLKRLRLLEISKCFNLKRVAPGVISSLVGLEELKIVKSFEKWEGELVEGKERKNAGLEELESLTNLRLLEIEVSDSKLAAQPLRLSPKLVKFSFQFGADIGLKPPKRNYHRRMSMNFSSLQKSKALVDLSTNVFLGSTDYLVANGNYADINLDLAKAHDIKWLSLVACWNLKNITFAAGAFPLLEFLSLDDLKNLEEIWDGTIPSNSFNNLKELSLKYLPALKQLGKSPYHNNNSVVPLFTNLTSISVNMCNGLHNLFSSSTRDCLLPLESISISLCEEMEQVVLLWNEQQNKENDTIVFPKLKRLDLRSLQNLTSICKGIQGIKFSLLAEMYIAACPNMKCIVSCDDESNSEEHFRDTDSMHLFCHPKVSFCNLKILSLFFTESKKAWCDQIPIGFFSGLRQLSIHEFVKITSLFSSSIALNLVNLQQLDITGAPEMVQVIEDEEEDVYSDDDLTSTTKQHTALFPNLQEMLLYGLPKLKSFCGWRGALELPSLKMLTIDYCHKLQFFIREGSLIAPALQKITIDGKELELNGTLHQHFAEAKKKEKTTKKNKNKDGGLKG